MKRILLIGHNDIRLFLKSKSGYVWLFLMPVVFVYFMGAINRGPGEPSNPSPALLIENQDQGYLGQIVVDELSAQGIQLIGEGEKSEAPRGIRIPEDFTERVTRAEEVKLEFFKVTGSDEESAAMVELRLFRALLRLNSNLFELAANGDSENPISEEALHELMERAPRVPMKIEFAGRNPIPVGFNQSLPGNLTMFLMMNLLIFGGASVVWERKGKLIQRLAVYPITKWQLVTGKIYGRFLLGCVQIVFFLLLGQLVFNVNVGRQFLGIALTLMIYSWGAAALGVLIGSITTHPDKTIGLCVLLAMVMGSLGGCWWPMEIVPDTIKMIGHVFPTAWTMDALHQLISFGGGISNIGAELSMLVLYAAGANYAAGKLMRY